uniref:Putative extracellular protein CSOL_045 n=1 Tax=Pseudococcomyxa simplex TaxID=464287 RepID=A0A7L9QE41_9CHLO|nr:putative extracellular protein CSOL_045 [Pseudococcomyxa simplex]
MAPARYLVLPWLAVLTVICSTAIAAPDTSQLAAATDAGLKYLANQAQLNLDGAKALQSAIRSGDLSAAKAAYQKARPHYEEVEVLYEAFPDIDKDIDNRAYAYPNGEASCGAVDPFARGTEFQGYHKIESLLYRDGDVQGAGIYADELVRDSEDLVKAFQDKTQFNASRTFDGIVDVATEIGSKKISSEEETYSDLSVLIFYHNFKGIQSQYEPFAQLVQANNASTAQAVTQAFSAFNASVSPYVTVTNGQETYAPYANFTNEQREAISRAAYQTADALTEAAAALGIEKKPDAGERVGECQPPIKFNGTDAVIQQGVSYFQALMRYQVPLIAALQAAISSGNISAARTAYVHSRPLYEQIEVLAGAFTQEDADIDARPYAFSGGDEDEDFKGFHKIERALYRDNNLAMAAEYAPILVNSTADLDAKVNDTSNFNSDVAFAGMMALANEVGAKKVSSEEETWSKLSNLIFYNNWKGIYSQLLPFAQLFKNTSLVDSLTPTFEAAFKCLPVVTKDVWSKVNATDVNQEFVDALIYEDYGAFDLSAANQKTRDCIVRGSYGIRDAILEVAKSVDVSTSCDPVYTFSSACYATA